MQSARSCKTIPDFDVLPMVEKPDDIPHLFAEAWNKRDATALAALFAENADFVNVVGLWWQNRSAIEKAHHYGLTTFFAESLIAVRRTKVRMIGPDAAVIHARWKLTGQIDSTGKSLEPRSAIMVFVAERVADRWIVQAAQNTDIMPGIETNAIIDGQMRSVDYRQAGS